MINIIEGLVGLWSLALQSSECSQVALLCAQQVEITSSGAATIFWRDSSNNTLVTQSLFDNVLPSARDLPYNVFLGVEYDVASPRHAAVLESNATFLHITETTSLLSSQSSTDFSVSHMFTLSDNDGSLKYQIQSQHTSLDIDLVYNYPSQQQQQQQRQKQQRVLPGETPATVNLPQVRPKPTPTAALKTTTPSALTAPSSQAAPPPLIDAPIAYNLNVKDAWNLNDPNFQANAMAISLQGLSNRHGANLYLTYPANWTFSYTSAVREFVETKKYAKFINLETPMKALSKLSTHIKSYVVWDEQVRDTLVVAFTIAGIENAIVVTPGMLPAIIQEHPELTMAANLTKKFRQNSSIEIYQWAFDKYKNDTNSSMLVWMGGVCPDKMQPGVGDFGVSRNAFFVELNTIDDPSNLEYPLASKIAATLTDIKETGAPPIVCGWHSYCSDYEHTFTTLVSKHGGRVHGLAENPNLSFMSQLSLPPDYIYHNQKSPAMTPERKKKLSSKVLIALVRIRNLFC